MKHCVYCNDGYCDIYYTIINDDMTSNGENFVAFSNTENDSVLDDGHDVIKVTSRSNRDKQFQKFIKNKYGEDINFT